MALVHYPCYPVRYYIIINACRLQHTKLNRIYYDMYMWMCHTIISVCTYHMKIVWNCSQYKWQRSFSVSIIIYEILLYMQYALIYFTRIDFTRAKIELFHQCSTSILLFRMVTRDEIEPIYLQHTLTNKNILGWVFFFCLRVSCSFNICIFLT